MPKRKRKPAEKPKTLPEDDEMARYEQFTTEILDLVRQLQEGRAADTGKVQTARIELTHLQRQTLLTHVDLKRSLRDRLNVASEETTTLDLTLLEMMELVLPLAPMVKSSRGDQAKEMKDVMYSLIGAMEPLLETSSKSRKKSRSVRK